MHQIMHRGRQGKLTAPFVRLPTTEEDQGC